MRFLENGPDIPDELLTARDEGRVVFFCGSGVSRAGANLPEFWELAESVMNSLGVSTHSPAYKAYSLASSILKDSNGLISADSIFGLLERDFMPADILVKVAQALKPETNIDLTPHRTILNLATKDGKLRLITTNFDRLFDKCKPDITVYKPPQLPDIANREDINGIVYLHGCCTTDYLGAEGEGLVLSSSEFGNAYLAEGWATRFYKEIIKKYVVVFVGYSADDPPVRYLLEAFNKTSGQFKDVYAFQAGDEAEAIGKWAHKGIRAISYDSANQHSSLWDTLSAWSDRASDVNQWIKQALFKAEKGPAGLKPHERGQIAHIVSSQTGAKIFATFEPTPPATWLCVFDSNIRLAQGYEGYLFNETESFKPFDNFCIDSDEPPSKNTTQNQSYKTSWDCFGLNINDLKDSNSEDFRSTIIGNRSNDAAPLSPRLAHIVFWIEKVSHQPPSVWWASYQNGIHHFLIYRSKIHLRDRSDATSILVRKAWAYLEESLDRSPVEWDRYFHIIKILNNHGWDFQIARDFIRLYKPRLSVKPANQRTFKPPANAVTNLKELIKLKVEYPQFINQNKILIPDSWLLFIVKEFRKNLELTLDLEKEAGGYWLSNLAPLHHREGSDNRVNQTDDLNGYVKFYAELFEKLAIKDTQSAKEELQRWPLNESIFGHLFIWSLGVPGFLSSAEFHDALSLVKEDTFWRADHQHDLLIAIKSRWHTLSMKSLKSIESRLKKGPNVIRNEETRKQFKQRSAWMVLTRLHWLQKQGCTFTFDLDEFTKKMSKVIPDWNDGMANRAMNHIGPRFGRVNIQSSYDVLLNIPISEILQTSAEVMGTGFADENFIKKDPFEGLCMDKPFRAYRALHHAALNRSFPAWAWGKLLYSNDRLKRNKKLLRLIAFRIAAYSESDMKEVLDVYTFWFKSVADVFGKEYPEVFDILMRKFIAAITVHSPTSLEESKTDDLNRDAFESSLGNLTSILYGNPIFGEFPSGQKLPDNWKKYAEKLLDIPGPQKNNAITTLSVYLPYIYECDPSWVEAHIFTYLSDQESAAYNAFWKGYLDGVKRYGPTRKVLVRLKQELSNFFSLFSTDSYWANDNEIIGVMFLSMWLKFREPFTQRALTNTEFREIILQANEDFRLNLLWQLRSLAGPESHVDSPVQEIICFLKEVWPLQKSIKTPDICGRLVDLPFLFQQEFPQLVEAILPHLTVFIKPVHSIINVDTADSILSQYSDLVLEVLYKVLPENAGFWPYKFEEVLIKIEESNPQLANDSKLIELKRIWDSR